MSIKTFSVYNYTEETQSGAIDDAQWHDCTFTLFMFHATKNNTSRIKISLPREVEYQTMKMEKARFGDQLDILKKHSQTKKKEIPLLAYDF